MHPLLAKVSDVAAKARRLVFIYAAARFATAVLPTLLGLTILDYFLRYDDRTPRFISFAVLLTVVAIAIRRWLLPATRYRPTLVEIAQRIELYFSELRGSLASSVDFLQSRTATKRPPAKRNRSSETSTSGLENHTIGQTLAIAERLRLNECLTAREVRNAQWLGLAFGVAVLAYLTFDPHGIGVARVCMPWSNTVWPRRHRLEIVDLPARVMAGQDLTVRVVDVRDRMPDRVQIEVRHPESEQLVERRLIRTIDNQVVDRIDRISRAIQIRATGGDDDTMDWRTVDVGEPPNFTPPIITLTPPEYTGLRPTTAPLSFRAIEGTIVDFEVEADKPLGSAIIQTSTADKELWNLELLNGRSLRIPLEEEWTLLTTGAYSLDVVDAEGLTVPGVVVGDIQVLADQPPEIAWEDMRSLHTVTPTGSIVLKASVRDDLLLKGVDLVIESVALGKLVAVPLYAGPEKPECPEFPRRDGGDETKIEYRLDVGQLTGLRPNDSITIKLVATDYKPNVKESAPLQLSIISSETLAERLGQSQSGLLAKLHESLKLQRETQKRIHDISDEAVRAADRKEPIEQSQRDQLKGVQHDEQRIRQWLSGGPDSAASRVDSLLREMSDNHLDRSTDAVRLESIRDRLAEINKQLGETSAGLAGAVRESDPARGADQTEKDATVAALEAVSESQRNVVAKLDEIIGQLTEWETLQRFAAEASRIEQTQRHITDATESLLESENSFKSINELSENDRKSVQQMGRQQLDTGRDLARLVERLRQTLPLQNEKNPSAAQALADAIDIAEKSEMASAMRNSGENLEQNKIGESLREQARLRDSIRELSNALSQQPEYDLSRIATSLQRTEQQLDELGDRQKSAAEHFDRAADGTARPDEFADAGAEQKKIGEQLGELGKRMERLSAQRAAESLRSAERSSGQAAKAAEDRDGKNAAAAAHETLENLDLAKDQLERDREAIEQRLAQQRLDRLSQAVADWIFRQRELREQSIALSNPPTENDSEKVGVALAGKQGKLEGEVQDFSQPNEPHGAFSLLLAMVSAKMRTAADALSAGDWSDVTPAQDTAIAQLQILADSLQQDRQIDQPPTNESPPQDANNGEGRREQNAPKVPLPELRLLRRWQQELQRRTKNINDAQRTSGVLTNEQSTELDELAEQEGRMVEFLESLRPKAKE